MGLLVFVVMEVLRTPDSQFSGLAGYPFAPKYHVLSEHSDMRMHYVDEGNKKQRCILMLHGEPSWSYLYRRMIAMCAEAGYRTVAPDLIGFGRSDKPARAEDYSYRKHEEWLESFVLGLDLKRIVLVCQDWGGLLGLRLVARFPERFDAVVAANTFLPSGREPVNDAFKQWQEFSQSTENFDVGSIVAKGCEEKLTEATVAAYNAPFPEDKYKAGARIFPALVPTDPNSEAAKRNQELWKDLAQFDKPFLTAFSDRDRITRGADKILGAAILGAKDAKHTTIKGGGHFLQEDRGPEFAQVVLDLANSLK